MNVKPPLRPTRAARWRTALLAALALGTGLVAPRMWAASYYVNDGSISNDLYCSSVGVDSNNGLSAATPVASLATILGRYTVTGVSDVIYVDAGTYTSTSNIVIGAHHGGSWDSKIAIQGAGRATVLSRNSQSAGSCCLLSLANYIAISNITFTGAEVGLAIDASSCYNAHIAGCTFRGNSGAGLSVQPSGSTHYGQFLISHNLFHNNGDGLVLEPQTGMMGDEFDIVNNTIIVTNGTAVIMGGQVSYSELRNNIVVAKGGTCFEVHTEYQMFTSDQNDLWAPDGGTIAKVTYNSNTDVLPSLAGWQRYTQSTFYGARDTHSFSRDPAFANPVAADFHLRSFGGRWLPDANIATGEFSLDGGSNWTSISNEMPIYAISGMAEWIRPAATIGSPSGCWIRVSCDADSSAADKALLENTYAPPPPSQFYVNDGSLSGDLWCNTAGSDTNDGLSPDTPVASLQTLLDRYTLVPSNTVYVDAGTYYPSSDIVVEARHSGDWNAEVTLQGAGRATVFRRQSYGKGDACLRVSANRIRIEGMTFADANVGLLIDSSYCSNAKVFANTFIGNTGNALLVEPSTNSTYGSIAIRNNLFVNNGDGMSLNANITTMSASFLVVNNTILATNGVGVLMGGYYMGSLVRNNIVVAENGAVCLATRSSFNQFASDYNDFWTPSGGAVARITVAVGNEQTFATLAQWQRFTQEHFGSCRDTHSFSRDPRFVSPINQDYHASSLGGSWHDGAWTADTVQSPCVDAGDPNSDWESLPFESAPNGGRLNMGAFGATDQASRTEPGRRLLALAPDQGQNTQQTQPLYWNATGQGWGASDALLLEYSLDGGTAWTNIATCTRSSSAGYFDWSRPPLSFNSPSGCWVRVSCADDASIHSEAFLENTYEPPPTVFFVNDNSLSNDLWCTAVGDYMSDGLSSNTPLDSIQTVLTRYNPTIGATIYVDAGTYLLYSDLVLPNTGSGGGPSNDWLRVIGANRRATLIRQYGGAGSCCLKIQQDFAHIEGLVLRGAETGILVDPATCRNAALERNTVTANSGFGIRVLPDPTNDGFDTYFIRNNLLFNNGGGGMNLQAASGFHRAYFTVQNNTVVVYTGLGIACGSRAQGTTLKNNIVSAKGTTGYCLSVDVAGALQSSDYNDFFAYNGASVVRWATNNAYRTAATLAEWQASSVYDDNSLALDPLFVASATGDHHLRSAGGSWRNGAWVLDTVTSPCVDAGDPTSGFANEPAPNGGRVNMGAFGNTGEASKSPPNRILNLLAPRAGEVWSGNVLVSWSAAGTGWQVGDTVRLEYATTAGGTTWTTLAGAASLARNGTFNWAVPNPSAPTAYYYLRVVCNQDPAVFDATDGAGSVQRVTVTYYVNDASTNNDQYCTAIGAGNNNGISPNAPLNSLAEVFKRNLLKPGDTVYVDTGSYALSTNVVIDAAHAGTADSPIRIIGTRGGSVFIRNTSGITNRYCLEIHADHLRVEGLTCRSADIGISVNASAARHIQLIGNICFSNTAWGIEVRPYGTLAGEEYQILQNVVFNNGAGLYLQSALNVYDGRGLFVVENNTVYGGGTGIKLLNANSIGKRTNLLKNNIIETTATQAACLLALQGSVHYSDFNNLKARPDGYVAAWQFLPTGMTGFTTLAQWRAASGADKSSLSADSSFMNAGAGNLRLKPSSPCVDAGIISFWMFGATDADGKTRLAGKTADMGAYELFLSSSVRLFLQGPFITGTDRMTDALGAAGSLALTSPYADDPRTVTRIPSNVTDWVLLQFRLATNGPAFISRSAFLRNDGWLVNDAGSASLSVDLPPGTNGYLVVKHRNHLAAMTSVPVAVTNQSLTYDFTQSPSAFFGGTNGCVEVAGSGGPRYALRAGDTDGDGTILPVDYAICASLTNTSGYRRSDVNLDRVVSLTDGDQIQWNLHRASTVPHPQTMMQPILLLTPSRKTLISGEFTFIEGPTSDNTAAGQGAIAAASPLTWDFVRHESDSSLVSVGDYQASYTAGPVTGKTDIVEAWDTAEGMGRAYLNVVGAQAAATAGKALVIAGRTSAGDTLWPTTDYLADSAYTTLRYRGFSKENIHYLSPDPAQDVDSNGLYDDIDGASTLAQAENAFTNVIAGTDRLFVYLVDHGGNSSGNGYFRLSGSETLTAAQLDAWLDNLQNAHNTHVTVLLDFCYAGSFLHDLTYNGAATRIVIAACDTNQPSYFVAGGLVSFSGAFFSGVMLGYDVMQCFTIAQSAMSTYQAAQLDDDKSGAYSTNDYAQATGSYIGPTTAPDGDAPQIGEVCGNQVLTEDASATLWIGSVSSLHPISRAWCLIVPPGHNPDPDNPVTDLPELDLAYDSASGRYAVTYDRFTASGTYYVSFYVQDDAGNVSAPRSSYIAQIGYDDRVILVAGGDTNSAAWPAIDYLTELAYDTFRLRLFTPDHIRVLSANPAQDLDGDGTNDVADVASLASLQAALGEWAITNSTDRLTLYMLGEGVTNTLRLSGSECLATNQLAAWLHAYQVTNPIPVTVVLDFSGAGAFLPALADPDMAEESTDASRIAIASSRIGREALFSNGGVVSFTQYLLSGVISGETLGDAYTDARRAIRRVSGDVRQSPQIDDNLNGIPSEKDVDGLLADETYLGSAFVTGADAPVIGSVIETTVLSTPGSPVTLWASEVAGMYPITNVWCVVTPPGFSEGLDLPALHLAWNGASSRYEAASSDFTQPGCYGLTFYAEDTAGELSDPVQSSVILADAYEPDDSADAASLYDGAAQLHTFHACGDEDWARVFLVTNFVYDIETYHLSGDLDTVIDFYRELGDGSLELVDHVDEEGSEEGEYTGLDFPATGWYWARISPYSATTNCVGAYQLIVDIPAADGLNTLVVLGVDDVYASALPSNSTVSVQGQATKTFSGSTTVVYSGLTNGTYLVNVPTPANFIAREAPNTPSQVQSLTNLTYANPRRVPVTSGWRLAGFEMLSTVAVTSGVVRDAWTHAFLGSAQIAFTASSGSLTGTVATGGVILTSYCTNWLSAATGLVPSGIALGACNWNLAVSLAGYQTAQRPNAVSNLAAGAKTSLGTVYLTPLDADSDLVADAWETLYFGGSADPEADPDNDSLDNRSEFLCGTDPTNALSALRITDAQLCPTNAALTWTVAAGRSYEVLSVTSLVNLASMTTNGPWEAAYGQSTMQWSGTHSPLHKARFYRIRLNAP